MATAAQIRDKAAKKLGLFGTGQTLRGAISADLDDAYTEVYGMLSKKKLTTWDSDEPIPDEFVFPVVALVADARKNEYAIPDRKYLRIMLDARGDGTPRNIGAIATIKVMQATNVYKTPTAEYF